MGTELLEKTAVPPEEQPELAPPEPPRKKRRGRRDPPQPPQPLPPGIKEIRRKAFRKGLLRLVTRNNAVNLSLVVLFSAVAVIFLLSLTQRGVGNFTISLNRTDLYKYGIELAEDPGFGAASSRLEAESIGSATNISVHDLPDHLEDLDGSHNGQHYIAYTFYVRNNGTADLDYRYQLDIKEVTRQLDSAVRVGLYYNGGERQIFAKRAADQTAEPGTVPFATQQVIDSGTILDMKIGSVDKYTVVIWIEGDDPECTDERLGGVIKMAMTIEVLEPQGEQ